YPLHHLQALHHKSDKIHTSLNLLLKCALMKAENLNPIFQTLREKSKRLKDFQNLNKDTSENISDYPEDRKFPFSILRSEMLISPDQEKQIRNNITKTRFSTKITGEKLINS